MKKQYKFFIIFMCAAASYTAGYYFSPTKTEKKIVEKVVVKEVEVDRRSDSSSSNTRNDLIVIEIETIYPDGTIVREKKTVDKGVVQIDLKSSQSRESSREREDSSSVEERSERKNDTLSLSVLGMSSLENISNVEYGLHAQRKILGPIQLGVFGFTNKQFGLSLGISF